MISIIIPTFGNLLRVRKLLNSIAKYDKASTTQIIIVNDNPQYTTKGLGNSITWIDNAENVGFAASINRGLKEAAGDILLLVNDDIVWTSPILDKIEKEFASDSELGVLGALLKYPRAGIQHAGMLFDTASKSFYHVRKDPKTQYMIAVTAALFGISRKLYETIGGLDEKFFLACEDTKYCLDAWDAGYKVKFSRDIVAVHEEGATRGKNPSEKKKHTEWTAKEAAGIIKFKSTLDVKKIASLQAKIRKLNHGSLRIEVGSGYNPHPGYKHLDIRKDLPQLDYVCDFTKERLPFEDGTVEEILANHLIEHLPFRLLPFVLKEWSRVLVDGGKLTLRTPNLRFICESYLARQTTPEWPEDEKFIKENLSDEITPAWWANLKLFSGQDYAANFHHCCFDFGMLSNLLNRFGFGKVVLAKFDREFSPGELQIEALKGAKEALSSQVVKKFEKVVVNETTLMDQAVELISTDEKGMLFKPIRESIKSCLVIRDGAMGDVILTTPIIERLSKEYGTIDVVTKIGTIFEHNPHVRSYFPSSRINMASVDHHYDRIIDLNNAYELRPKMHIIDAYSEVAFGDHATPIDTYLYRKTASVIKENYIVIHASKSWENRTWNFNQWQALIAILINQQERVVTIGSGNDFWSGLPLPCDNQVGKQTFWEMVDTISSAKLFIGMDSGPLHVAEAIGIPAIGLYTCANHLFRSTSSLTLPVYPRLDCYGCLHDEKPPVHYVGCRRNDFACLTDITVEKVLKAYEQF